MERGWGALGGVDGEGEGEGRREYASKLSLGPEMWRKGRREEGGEEEEGEGEEEEEGEEDFDAALARVEAEEAASRRAEGRWWWRRWMSEVSTRWFLFKNKGRYKVKREQGRRRYV